MYAGDWENVSKASSPLAAGLFQDLQKERSKKGRDKEKKEDKDKDDRLPVDRYKSKDFEPPARSLAAPADGLNGEEERAGDKEKRRGQSPNRSEKDSLLRQVKRMIVERVQHELAKVDQMIQDRIQHETQSLRVQIESLQRDVGLMRSQADGPVTPVGRQPLTIEVPRSKDATPQHSEAKAGQGATYDDLMSVNTALKKAKQGIEAQVSDLWAQIAAMQEGLEAAHLRHKLRFVATSMLALGASELSAQEKEISKRALEEEEAALKERLQALADRAERAPSKRGSQGSSHFANGRTPSSNNLTPVGPSREASTRTAAA